MCGECGVGEGVGDDEIIYSTRKVNEIYYKYKNMTQIQELGEFRLIDALTECIELQNESSKVGVGDDCAVMNYGEKDVVATTDLLL